jgi:hypothetical protein
MKPIGYSRTEMMERGNKPPQKGIYCTKYGEIIPILSFMDDEQSNNIKRMSIDGRGPEAIDILMKEIGCSRLWATLIVVHHKCSDSDHVIVL